LKRAKYSDALCLLGDLAAPQPEGYATDKRFSDIYYVPEDSVFNVLEGTITWSHGDRDRQITLRKDATYFLPSGFRIRLEKQHGGTAWRLVGARPRGTLCHKPCTVSGGGKSEISKSIANALLKGPVFVKDYHRDMDQVAEIFERDFSTIYRRRAPDARTLRPILSPERTLGSVIQLFTPSPEYTDEHNEWVRQLPQTIRQLLFTVKRYYQPAWGNNWRRHFTVDHINGFLGHELKFENQPLLSNYLRVGFEPGGAWRIYKLRPDFHPADKVAVEDDITASVVLPRQSLSDLDPEYPNPSVKLVANCELRLFQRPDDAIRRGDDRQAEADIAGFGNFFSNFEAFDVEQARHLVDHVAEFDRYTEPMRLRLESFVRDPETRYVVSSAHARLVNGAPSTNPRYLQQRPDLVDPRDSYLAEIAARLEREIPSTHRVYQPVSAVLAGRRNSPPDSKAGLPPLAVYGPIHYQELPELFMDFISSLTGKSPATTGFGSEGALTKGPFNALWPVVDLNNALVSAIVTGYAGFTTSAGFVGPNFRVDHDVSLLVPEIWCRMRVHERDPEFLKTNGYLEQVCDFCIDGRTVLASRLGYRITELFADHFLGRIFETPDAVFTAEMLQPEKQDIAQFAAGVDAIVETQTRVALQYFEDGSVDAACPPLRALLHIMAHGSYEGLGVDASQFRGLFARDAMLQSDWYRERLTVKQQRDIALWTRHVAAVEAAGLDDRLKQAQAQLARVREPAYLLELEGTIGADPFHLQFGPLAD